MSGDKKKGNGGKRNNKGQIIQGGRNQENVRVKKQSKFSKSSRDWLERQLNDPYVKQAKKDGYRSRATYKIQEIHEQFKIFAQGQRIVDLGAAPGGWCQYAMEKLKGNATIVGIDLLHVKPIDGCIFIEGDFTDDDTLKELEGLLEGEKVDVVLSDMAPNSTGHTKTDHLRIMLMLELALEFAKDHLKPGGSFVCKVLRGGTEKELLIEAKKHFEKVKHFKPKSSRVESTEMYLVAQGFRKV